MSLTREQKEQLEILQAKKQEELTPEEIQQMNDLQNQLTDDNSDDDNHYDPDYVRSLETRIAEQQIANRRMEMFLEQIQEDRNNRPEPTPPPRNIEAERTNFYEDPVGSLEKKLEERDNRIVKQMSDMLKPLQEVASVFKTNREYETMKGSLKHDPIFGKMLSEPDVESAVDNIMLSGQIKLTEDALKSAVAGVFGMKVATSGSNGGERKPSNLPRNSRIDPPHHQPTRFRVEGDVISRKELTEDDRLAMRNAGLKPGNKDHEDEYWKLITEGPMVLGGYDKKKEGK